MPSLYRCASLDTCSTLGYTYFPFCSKLITLIELWPKSKCVEKMGYGISNMEEKKQIPKP